MAAKYSEGERIIADTPDGRLEGTAVTVEKPDVAGRTIGAILTAVGNPVGLLGLDAVDRETNLRTDDGKVHKIDGVVARHK